MRAPAPGTRRRRRSPPRDIVSAWRANRNCRYALRRSRRRREAGACDGPVQGRECSCLLNRRSAAANPRQLASIAGRLDTGSYTIVLGVRPPAFRTRVRKCWTWHLPCVLSPSDADQGNQWTSLGSGIVMIQSGRFLMDRRSFIRKAGTTGIGAAAATAALAAPAIAQSNPKVTWRLASSFPEVARIRSSAARDVFRSMFRKRLTAISTIQVFAAGELVPALQAADAVTAGTVEAVPYRVLLLTGARIRPGRSARPCRSRLNARGMNAWHYHGGGIDMFNEFLGNAGPSRLFRRQHRRPDGRLVPQGDQYRCRSAGPQDAHRRVCGQGSSKGSASCRSRLAGGDIYPALEKGTIDAAEWVGPYDDEKLGF